MADQFPKDLHFRDTHGRILGKLERWQEAVKELEYALPLLPPKVRHTPRWLKLTGILGWKKSSNSTGTWPNWARKGRKLRRISGENDRVTNPG